MDEAIINHIKREYKLLIASRRPRDQARNRSAYDMREELAAEVRGATCSAACRRPVVLSSEEVRRALDEPVQQIMRRSSPTLGQDPAELAADIMDRGIVMAGAGPC